MMVGLKENVPYAIHSQPESRISGDSLKGKIEKGVKNLFDIGFRVQAVISDNHSNNVAAFNILTAEYERDNDSLRVWINYQPIYLFYDSVHRVKNLRKNLLTHKQLLFPPFICDAIEQKQKLKFAGAEISSCLLHKFHEKDKENKANLRAAPKLPTTVLHPGNCKQSVPAAMAIFVPSTRAAILKYFTNAQDSADFFY